MSKVRNKVRFTLRLKTEQECASRKLGSSPDKSSTAEAQHNEACSKKGLELHTNERTSLLSMLNNLVLSTELTM